MKKIHFVIFVFLFITSSQAQGIEYHPLDDADWDVRFGFLNQVIEENMVEQIPELEIRFQQQESLMLQLHFLRALKHLNAAETTVSFTHDFIQNTFIDPYNEADIIDFREYRTYATEILFSFNDFSTYEYVYQYFENHSGREIVKFLDLLKKVGLSLPSEKAAVISMILDIIHNDEEAKTDCFSHLIELDTNTALSELTEHLSNDLNEHTRYRCMILIRDNFDVSDFKELFQSLLYSEPVPLIRLQFCNILLDNFTSPADIEYIRMYIESEPDQNTAESMELGIRNFNPEKPDLAAVSYQEMFQNLQSLLEECFSYNWIDEYLYEDHLNRIIEISNTFNPEPPNEACYNLSLYIEYAYSQEANLKYAWPYLHYYPVYIKEKIKLDEYFCE